MCQHTAEISELIRQKAKELGFFACGFSDVLPFSSEKKHLDKWLANHFHANMNYMERHQEKRISPEKLIEGTVSIVCVLLNYHSSENNTNSNFRISRFAWGNDYHTVLKQKLAVLISYMAQFKPDLNATAFVDSAPVLEKALAARAGLGWIGKNTCLINKTGGSYFFIGEIFSTLKLVNDSSAQNYCGSCTKCIDSCPTGALTEPYSLDARKCISYLTIEHRGSFEQGTPVDFKNYIFGCDICQDACPWNRFAKSHNEPFFKRNEATLYRSKEEWEIMTPSDFKKSFKHSCIARAGFEGMLRNIQHNRCNKTS